MIGLSPAYADDEARRFRERNATFLGRVAALQDLVQLVLDREVPIEPADLVVFGLQPRSGCYSDLADMKIAQFASLLMKHPFVDGNKRVAFFAMSFCD